MAFEGLSAKLQEVTRKLRGKARITESDLKEILREVKLALLEADVNYKIVKEFIAKKGIDKNFGARPLRRTIQNLIEDRLAEFILDGELCKNEDKTMYEEDGKIILR